ncbi:unnamed protein product [Hymenolepis diminuta]|uniref:Uncharacterized protein n=1 Tax=Hymenolepis diminuta TaxID=6216 RepID=A0A564Z2F1_HYMDI|nr:unnamed protein product [Hymenolepis diminuta]VUZ53733.1 unnamed protein product [Hymenolepis diminuta]
MSSRGLTQVTHIKLALFSRQNNARWSLMNCYTSCSPPLLLSTPLPLSLCY